MQTVFRDDYLKYFKMVERLDEKAARQIAENNKVSAFSVMDKLKVWNRPSNETITIVDGVKRYEPFWFAEAERVITYKMISSYTVDIKNTDAQKIEINGTHYEVKGDKVHIPVTEHCESKKSHIAHVYGVQRDVSKKEIIDFLEKHSSEQQELSLEQVMQDNLLIQPERKLASILHAVEKELAHAVNASEVVEDTLTFDKVYLYYHPVYAFECLWQGKSAVLEVDGLNGKPIGGGRMKKEMLEIVKDPDFLMDVAGDAMDIVIPGGRLPLTILKRLRDAK
jgi:hypothetical protein